MLAALRQRVPRRYSVLHILVSGTNVLKRSPYKYSDLRHSCGHIGWTKLEWRRMGVGRRSHRRRRYQRFPLWCQIHRKHEGATLVAVPSAGQPQTSAETTGDTRRGGAARMVGDTNKCTSGLLHACLSSSNPLRWPMGWSRSSEPTHVQVARHSQEPTHVPVARHSQGQTLAPVLKGIQVPKHAPV